VGSLTKALSINRRAGGAPTPQCSFRTAAVTRVIVATIGEHRLVITSAFPPAKIAELHDCGY
jgi:hypothetical protein